MSEQKDSVFGIQQLVDSENYGKQIKVEHALKQLNKRVLIYLRKHRNDQIPADLALTSRTVKYYAREAGLEKKLPLPSKGTKIRASQDSAIRTIDQQYKTASVVEEKPAIVHQQRNVSVDLLRAAETGKNESLNSTNNFGKSK